MKAVILVGGLGTRLRPLTLNTPKSMVPVLNVPLLEHTLRRLSGYGVKDIVLALSHLAPPIENYFGDGSRLGLSVKYVEEVRPLGTAGAARNAFGLISDTCLVINGDIFTGLDIQAMIACHQRHQAVVTISLTSVDNPSAYGLVETNKDGRVQRFVEKPPPAEITTNMINAGIYIVEPEVLAAIPENTLYSFERNVFPAMLAKDEPVYTFTDESYWMDIGTPQKYQQLHRDLLQGKCGDCGIQAIKAYDGRFPSAPNIVGPVVVGDDCVIGERVTLVGPTVIGPRCRIEDGALVSDAVIWENVVVGAGSCVSSSIVANDCQLGPDCQLADSVVGDHVTLPRGCRHIGGQIWPESGSESG